MKAERPGTEKRRMERFIRHMKLMEAYIAQGMDKEAASQRAFDEVIKKKSH